MVSYRSFIAADFPDRIIEKIGLIQKSLKEDIPSFVNWTNLDNIHLTLKFLGEIKLEKIQGIEESLDNIAFDTKPFSLELGGIGAFPNWRNPRIIWVGFEKSESLNSLVRLIEASMSNLGCQKEVKPFSPHLTIGRIRDYFRKEDIQILEKKSCTLKRIADITQVSEIHLYKSDLFRLGPVYTLIHTSPFKTSL